MDKIYIVEDDKSIRDMVVYALKSSNFEASGFECAEEFYKVYNSDKPSLVILDIMLPGEDGMAILQKVRKDSKSVPVIMLTAKTAEFDKVMGLDAGADDYISKPFGILELVSRIKAVLRRYNGQDEGDLSHNGVTIDKLRHIVRVMDENVVLTNKEFKLLTYLIENKGIVLSRDKILFSVWGYEYEGESRTVDMHIKTLRQKLGEKGEIIETVRGVGYKIGE